jgi:hypothetical protein
MEIFPRTAFATAGQIKWYKNDSFTKAKPFFWGSSEKCT